MSSQNESAALGRKFHEGDMVECIDQHKESGLTSLKRYIVVRCAEGHESPRVVVRNDYGFHRHYPESIFEKVVIGPLPPNQWKVGDIVKCIAEIRQEIHGRTIILPPDAPIIGKEYRITGISACGFIEISSGVDKSRFIPSLFEFVRRPEKPAEPQSIIKEPRGPRAFWIVKSDHGPANYEHTCVEYAEAEAKRLAKQYPGVTFTVLGPVSSYCVSEFQRHDLMPFLEAGEDYKSDIPF